MNLLLKQDKTQADKDATLNMALTYMAPVIQGLAGQQSPELAGLFNQLLSEDGLQGIKDLQGKSKEDQYAALIPFIEPLIQGLNSEDASELSAILIPLMSKQDPAAAVAGLLSSKMMTQNPQFGAMTSVLTPALQSLMSGTVPDKQVLASQLLQGLLGGTYTDLRVVDDAVNGPGVVVSGSALDIFQLAQLPNVSRVVQLPK